MSIDRSYQEASLYDDIVERLIDNGWRLADTKNYDPRTALYTDDVWGWLEETSANALAGARRRHTHADALIMDGLIRALESPHGGTLEVLRKGFQAAGAGRLEMSVRQPANASQQTTQ